MKIGEKRPEMKIGEKRPEMKIGGVKSENEDWRNYFAGKLGLEEKGPTNEDWRN